MDAASALRRSVSSPSTPAPSHQGATRTYATDWGSTKFRWARTADRAEKDAPAKIAAGCPDSTVGYPRHRSRPAPGGEVCEAAPPIRYDHHAASARGQRGEVARLWSKERRPPSGGKCRCKACRALHQKVPSPHGEGTFAVGARAVAWRRRPRNDCGPALEAIEDRAVQQSRGGAGRALVQGVISLRTASLTSGSSWGSAHWWASCSVRMTGSVFSTVTAKLNCLVVPPRLSG